MKDYASYNQKNISELHYNYRASASDGKEVFCEDWNTAKVGEKGVTAIHEHSAGGEGDRWFYDILHEDGNVIRTFNPCKVIFKFVE